MKDFLDKDDENIAVIHCNAGKGRTGTLIACYMLYCGFARTAQESITYYGWKRLKNGEGVTQPSQLRYIFYFEKLLQGKVKGHKRVKLDKIYIQNLPDAEYKKLYRLQARVKSVRDYKLIDQTPEELIDDCFPGESIEIDFEDGNGTYLENDVFFSIMHLSKKKFGNNDKELCHFSINTSFLNPKNDPSIQNIH